MKAGGDLPFGLYIHVPFCPQRCPYCAFAVVTGRGDMRDRYIDAVCAELAYYGNTSWVRSLDTVFIGGGTPSQLEASHIRRLLRVAHEEVGVRTGAEITIEANPANGDRGRFSEYCEVGVNRISIGAQSFSDAALRKLGRRHSVADIYQAVAAARGAGFDSLSLDLIHSVPGVPPDEWEGSLKAAIELCPQHISTYGLTFEEGTIFHNRWMQGRLQPVAEDDDADQYKRAVEVLATAGYEQYEVSNFARPGFRSRHNWGCWTGCEYLGGGLSAHSFIGDVRSWNSSQMQRYLDSIERGESPREGEELIAGDTARREALWFGLRTSEGVELSETEDLALTGSSRFGMILAEGLMYKNGRRLKLTTTGFPLADALGTEIITTLEPAGTNCKTGTRQGARTFG